MKLSELKPWSQITSLAVTAVAFGFGIASFFVAPWSPGYYVCIVGFTSCVVALFPIMGFGKKDPQ